jgi:hypothetical protein
LDSGCFEQWDVVPSALFVLSLPCIGPLFENERGGSMDSSMIGKIEKAMRYAQEPDRITFQEFRVHFTGDHKVHLVGYHEGQWSCDCDFFAARGVCSHVMTLERVLRGMVEPAATTPLPA